MAPKATTSDPNLASQIAEGITAGLNTLAPKKLTYGQYLKKQPKKPELKRTCFQNGFFMRADNLTAEEITLLNQITHSGRYLERRVEVIVRDEGSDHMLELRYANKTTDQRLDLKSYFRNLVDLLQQIIAAQALERAAKGGSHRDPTETPQAA